ncbi:MAG: hypothetical protein LBP39_02760 [Rickettsiales bacterium]|nr:hypothetical protein [Rickettsiales bacterium]
MKIKCQPRQIFWLEPMYKQFSTLKHLRMLKNIRVGDRAAQFSSYETISRTYTELE